MTKNRLLVFTLAMFSAFYIAMPHALAQERGLQKWEERLKEKYQNKKDKIEERVEKRCDVVNNHINNRINRYDENYEEVEASMDRVTTRTDEFVDRLEKKGYDVSQIREDLSTLKDMRNTRRSLYTTFIEKLRITQQYDCGDSEGAFREALQEARTALTDWREQVKATREFINSTLRTHLEELKEQNPSSSTGE